MPGAVREGACVVYISNTQRTTIASFPDDGGKRGSEPLDYILTRLIAREDFIAFSRRESYKSYKIIAVYTENHTKPINTFCNFVQCHTVVKIYLVVVKFDAAVFN
jgi:hypothetical protein